MKANDELLKHLKETLSITKMLKNAYNSSISDNEPVTPKDVNIMLDVIIEKLNNLLNICKL